MALRISVDTFLRSLCFSLGITPLVACGGSTSIENGGTGGSGGGGGSATGGSGNGGSGATGGGSHFISCSNPTPVLSETGQPTGYVRCENGATHRPAAQACPFPPRNSACPLPVGCDPSLGTCIAQCSLDSDCTDQPHGRCASHGVGNELPGCSCDYGCVTDSECGAGRMCVCDGFTGHCATTGCASDADCKGGALCASYVESPGCGGIAFACQTTSDECLSDSECASGMQCSYDGVRHVCKAPSCAIGRPFLVNGEALLAPCIARDDFRSALTPDASRLSKSARTALAERWTEIGLMEHASIAAFARFTMDLLAFGAPSELVASSVTAMGDETRHAKDAFALASTYAGRALGPGELVVPEEASARSREDVVVTAILEGCIGETIAAVEAAEAYARAEDPAVKAALSRVSEDEMRHAELAWRFVDWVLRTANGTLAGRTRDALAVLVADAVVEADRRRPLDLPEASPLLSEHGVLSAALRAEIRYRVLTEIVAPGATSLDTRAHTARTPRAA